MNAWMHVYSVLCVQIMHVWSMQSVSIYAHIHFRYISCLVECPPCWSLMRACSVSCSFLQTLKTRLFPASFWDVGWERLWWVHLGVVLYQFPITVYVNVHLYTLYANSVMASDMYFKCLHSCNPEDMHMYVKYVQVYYVSIIVISWTKFSDTPVWTENLSEHSVLVLHVICFEMVTNTGWRCNWAIIAHNITAYWVFDAPK